MKNKVVSSSPRFQKIKREKNKAKRKKVFIWVSIFLFILIVLSQFVSWKEINITEIKIYGNNVVDGKQIEDIVRGELQGKYMYFIPKTNFIFYPKEDIKEKLTKNFKILKNIDLHTEDPKTLKISLEERVGLYTWCQGISIPNPNIKDAPRCYFLDEEGYIFNEAPYFSGNVYLRFYGGMFPEGNPYGMYFFKDRFKDLILFKESLETIGLKPSIFYVTDSDVSVYLLSRNKNDLGPRIVFKTDSDYQKIIENLQSVLSTEPMSSDFKNKYSSISYIDLRYGNKVYYKVK